MLHPQSVPAGTVVPSAQEFTTHVQTHLVDECIKMFQDNLFRTRSMPARDGPAPRPDFALIINKNCLRANHNLDLNRIHGELAKAMKSINQFNNEPKIQYKRIKEGWYHYLRRGPVVNYDPQRDPTVPDDNFSADERRAAVLQVFGSAGPPNPQQPALPGPNPPTGPQTVTQPGYAPVVPEGGGPFQTGTSAQPAADHVFTNQTMNMRARMLVTDAEKLPNVDEDPRQSPRQVSQYLMAVQENFNAASRRLHRFKTDLPLVPDNQARHELEAIYNTCMITFGQKTARLNTAMTSCRQRTPRP